MRRASTGHVARYGSLVLETNDEDGDLLLLGASGGAKAWGNHGGGLATLGSPSRCAQSRFLSEAARTRVPVQVVDMWVRYLSEVSTVDQTFKTAFQLDLRWPATARDEEEWERDRAGFTPETVPCVEFTNAKEVEMERRSYPDGSCFLVLGQHTDGYERGGTVEPDAQGAGEAAARFVFMRLLVSGTFMCSFDLASFPFDVQTLPVSMDMSFSDASTTMFVPARGALDLDARRCGGDSFVTLNREFSALADFELERVTAEFACRTTRAEAVVANAFAWGQLVVQFQIVRRWEGHVVRLAFLAFLLSLVSVASFGYDIVDSLNDRAGFIMNLVMANTAFQLVVSESLPCLRLPSSSATSSCSLVSPSSNSVRSRLSQTWAWTRTSCASATADSCFPHLPRSRWAPTSPSRSSATARADASSPSCAWAPGRWLVTTARRSRGPSCSTARTCCTSRGRARTARPTPSLASRRASRNSRRQMRHMRDAAPQAWHCTGEEAGPSQAALHGPCPRASREAAMLY